jgi:hypothetical protein
MIETDIAAVNCRQKKWLHFPEIIWQLRGKRPIIIVEPPVAFLPRVRSLTLKLFPKIFPNERMCIQLARIMRIFPNKESCSS